MTEWADRYMATGTHRHEISNAIEGQGRNHRGRHQRHWQSCRTPICQRRREDGAWCSPRELLGRIADEIHETGGEATALVGNVKEAEYAKRLVDLAECAFGGLDVEFNNTGIIGDVGPITDMAPENWHDVIAVWSKERNQTAFYGFCTLISGELAQCNYSVKASGRKQLAPPYANSVSADNAS
tara:strand:- start:3726 stop:4274 length:549 start_codon:yes stop_codon:yes gene_type:complete